MGKPGSTSGSGGSTVYNTVFIDTSLDTHLAMIVSDFDTVSDLKKKILYEHPLCFPDIGEIKINALKVKRKGYLYHLSDSMFVKSAFDGVSKSWFLSVDASSADEHGENHNSQKPDTGNLVACFGITTNNSSADVVDFQPDGTSKRLSNMIDSSLPRDGNNHHAASQQFGFGNSGKANSEDLHMEVEHTADSNFKVLCATNKGSRPEVQEKDVGDNKICEDLQATVAASDLQEKHKTKKRKKDVIHDLALKENGASLIKRIDSIDQNASPVNSHPASVYQEGINLQNDIGVSGHENQSGMSEDKIVEPKKSFRKRKKSKKTKDPVGEIEALDARDHRGPASDIPPERPTSITRDHLSDKAQQDGTTDGKEEQKGRTSNCLPSVTDVRADDVIQNVLESLQQFKNDPENAEKVGKKSRKKTKKKSSTVFKTPELPGKRDVDHQDRTVLADNVGEVSASSKSPRKTKVVNSSLAAQLNGSDLGSKNKRGVGISSVKTQLESSQNTLKANHEGRPTRDVVNGDLPKSTHVVDGSNSIEVPCESERKKSQQQQEIVDSWEIVVDKATDKKGLGTELKGKEKRKPDVHSGVSAPDVSSSQMLNGNQHKKAKAQAAQSSSIQSQRSSSKFEPYSSPLQASKRHLTISGSAAKEPLQSNKSEKINSIPKESQRPVDINSSRSHIGVDKNNVRAASISTLERSKNSISLKKGDNKRQSHLDIAKDTGRNNGKVVNSPENKKSLLAVAGTIFKHDDKESSDDEDAVENSDDSTRTPSDNSSNDDSDMNNSSRHEGEEGGGRGRKDPRSASPKNMSLHEILRSSSSYKKAKLTASQSQPDEFFLDSQAN